MVHSAADWLDKSKQSQTGLLLLLRAWEEALCTERTIPKTSETMRELHRGFWQKQTWPQKPFSSGRTHPHDVSELLRLSSLLQPMDSDRKDEPRVDRNLLFPTVVTGPYI